MGKSKTSGRRKRRGGSSGPRKKGLLLGMRSGFKNAAASVAGTKPATNKKGSLAGTLFTVLLLVAAAALLLRRFS